MNLDETRAALRILVAVAQADGHIDPKETTALQHAIVDWAPELASRDEVASLFATNVDVAAELAKITTPATKRAVFEAAIAMAVADGRATDAENRVLSQVREALGQNVGLGLVERSMRDRPGAWNLARSTEPRAPILDPEERDKKVKAIILQHSLVGFVFGFIPLPVLSGVLVAIQFDRMIDRVALAWGRPLTRKERLEKFGGYLATATMGGMLHSLLHVVPIVGSAAAAGAAFATTMAVGHVVNTSFQKGGKATKEELAKAFAEGKEHGKAALVEHRTRLETQAIEQRDAITALTKQLEADEIDIEEYDRRVGEIVYRTSSG